MIHRPESAKKLCENGSKTHMENLTAFVPAAMQLLRGYFAPIDSHIP